MYKDFLDVVPAKVLGLTATPYRLSTDQFGGAILKFLTRTRPKVFSDLIYYEQVKTLMDQGYLSPIKYYSLKVVDPSELEVNSTGADYKDESVKAYYKMINFREEINKIIIRMAHANRKNILVFTKFVEEAQYIVDAFPGEAAIITGTTKPKERERILADFKSGKIGVVANVGVLTVGFDFPELETVIMARPTMSLALYYQIVGRLLRPYPNKIAWFIDLCSTFERFGKVEDLEIVDKGNGKWVVESNGKQLTNRYFE